MLKWFMRSLSKTKICGGVILFKPIINQLFVGLLALAMSHVLGPSPVYASEELPSFVYEGYRIKAQKGGVQDMFFLGILNEQGLAPESSTEKALFWYSKSAESGHLDAALSAARIYASQGDEENSFKMQSIAAELGSIEASYNLGLAYEYGLGVSKDLALAIEHYEISAEGGLAIAMRQLAMLYWRGEGSEPNISLSKTWLEKAVTAGDVKAAELLKQLESSDSEFVKTE